MLPIGLNSCSSPSIILLFVACLSRRASGSMRILHFTALALLAGFAYSTPISSHALLRNFTTNSLLGITPTSTDTTASAVSDLPTFGTCRAFYYDPKDDVPCGVVARQFTIFLTYPEYDQPSTAQWCEVFLNGNGICRETSPNSPSAFPTSKPSTLSISTVAPTTENAASANTSASASATASTSTLCATTSSLDTAGSPAAAIASGNGSTGWLASAASTARTVTSTREPVVLASVRASEYSATVSWTGSTPSVNSLEGLALTVAPPASGNSTPAAGTFSPAINATRTIRYNMGHGNATSLRTVLVTAHIASGASTIGPAIASGGMVLGSNSTLAARGIRAIRQANLTSSSTYQVVDPEPTPTSGTPDLLGSTTTSWILASTATSTFGAAAAMASPSISPDLAGPTPATLPDTAQASSEIVIPTRLTALPISTPSSYTSGSNQYTPHHGDGTPEQGWPKMSDWLTWDDLTAANQNILASACTYWVVKENSPEEVDSLLAIILHVAEEGGLDPRVLLAMTLQESQGCLRVPSTMGSHTNPGILQSHIGDGSCNTNIITAGEPGPMADKSLVWNTCPVSQIETMVRDGALGTPAGDGILQLLERERDGGYSGAHMWYRVARGYNSGSVDASNVLELGAATHAYASDIANRLTGWNSGPSQFA